LVRALASSLDRTDMEPYSYFWPGRYELPVAVDAQLRQSARSCTPTRS